MNMPDFIGQTYQASVYPIDDILRFFDHSMAIYDIIKSYNVTGVYGITDNNHYSLQMQIMAANPADLDSMVNYINCTLLNLQINCTIHNRKDMYGKTFQVNAQSIGTCASLSVQECR